MTAAAGAPPHVVIVGAGFGGLSCARELRHAPVRVTLVERNNYHLFQPLLYQVASGLLDPSQIAYPVRTIFRRARNVHVVRADVTGVDLDTHTVATTAGPMHYDVLVLAAGSTTDYFGNNDFRTNSQSLKRLEQAIALRSHVLERFEQAATCSDADERRTLLTFAVVGGGPTGVEWAGALAELFNHVLPKDYPEIDFSEVRVVLLEASDRLLAAFAPRLGRLALRKLRRKGVDVRPGSAIADIEGNTLVLRGGERIAAGSIVWTAGVAAVKVPISPTIERNRHGQIAVTDALHLPSHREVFVIGDMAAATSRGQSMPMLAPVAIQEGQHVARVIRARLHSEGEDAPFRYFDKGTMATIGRGAAVAQIGPIRINGLIGWVLWAFVHLLYLIGFRNRLIAMVTWGWNYFFYDRPVRLITERTTDGEARRS